MVGLGTGALYPAAVAMVREQADRLGVPAPARVLVDTVGWRAVFAINAPLGLLVTGLGLLHLPRSRPRVRAAAVWRLLDVPGVTLFSGAVTLLLGMSAVGTIASRAGVRGSRPLWPLLVPARGVLAGSLTLTGLDPATPTAVLACVVAVFGLPNGMGQVANQVAVYRAAPVEQVGAAIGLSRTAQYTGAMIATSVTGLAYAPGVADPGLQVLGWLFSAVGIVLVAVTLADRSLRRPVDPPSR